VDDQLEEVLVESLVEVVPGMEGRIGVEMTGHSTRPKAAQEGDITTAMPGTVVKVKVRIGDRVKAGETVLIIEAMKLENEVHTPIAGEVKAIHVAEGDRVNPDEVLVVVR
jgi:pyruvate carboxylase subunit B